MELHDLALGTYYEFPLEPGEVHYYLDEVRRKRGEAETILVFLRYNIPIHDGKPCVRYGAGREETLEFFLSNACPVTGTLNNVIGRFLDLPHYIVFDDIEFNLEIFPNGDELRLSYSISSVEKHSKHYLTITEAGYWDNPLLLKNLDEEPPEDPATIIKNDGYFDANKEVSTGYSCSFLYLVEGIENIEDWEEAVTQTKDFLTKHNLLQ